MKALQADDAGASTTLPRMCLQTDVVADQELLADELQACSYLNVLFPSYLYSLRDAAFARIVSKYHLHSRNDLQKNVDLHYHQLRLLAPFRFPENTAKHTKIS